MAFSGLDTARDDEIEEGEDTEDFYSSNMSAGRGEEALPGAVSQTVSSRPCLVSNQC